MHSIQGLNQWMGSAKDAMNGWTLPRIQSIDGLSQGLNHLTMDSTRNLIVQWMDFIRAIDSLGRKWIRSSQIGSFC